MLIIINQDTLRATIVQSEKEMNSIIAGLSSDISKLTVYEVDKEYKVVPSFTLKSTEVPKPKRTMSTELSIKTVLTARQLFMCGTAINQIMITLSIRSWTTVDGLVKMETLKYNDGEYIPEGYLNFIEKKYPNVRVKAILTAIK